MKAFAGWGTKSPIYVTRKAADGTVGYLSMSVWMQLVVLLLAWSNALLWGVVGLVYAVKVLCP